MKLKQLNILLADDDSDDCYFFKEALKEFSSSTQLTVVHDGEQLMNYLSENSEHLPDVLFLDLNMSRKNGFECVSEIKSNEKLKQFPLIIYSTSYHKKIADMLYENGVNYYISKPAEISQLKKVVQETLTLIAQGNTSRSTKENFVITTHRKNYQKLSWFKHFFTPDSYRDTFAENSN